MTDGARAFAIESDRDECDGCGGPHNDFGISVGWFYAYVCVGCIVALRDMMAGEEPPLARGLEVDDAPERRISVARPCDGCAATGTAKRVRVGYVEVELCLGCFAALRDQLTDVLAKRAEVEL